MATKTVILWPIGTFEATDSRVSWVPTDVDKNNLHMLVNESVADDDATCITIDANSFARVSFYVDFPIGKTISSIKVYCRAKTNGDMYGVSVKIATYDESNENLGSEGGTATSIIGEWSNYVVEMPSEAINSINSEECRYAYLMLLCGKRTTSSSKGELTETSYTQVYVEVTYEEPETATPIYLRENGTWNAVSGIIYRKENGAWTEADDTVFTQGDQFALNVIN